MGLSIKVPKLQSIENETQSSYIQAIKNNFAGHQMITILTPGSSQREDLYSAIKKLCCTDIGIPSQVVRCSSFSGNKSALVCQNILLQIVCKLGGQLWGVHIPYSSCMFIGLDTYHSPTQRERSVVGVVASLNTQATLWYSKVYFQNKKKFPIRFKLRYRRL